MISESKKTVVVIGNGMVGHRLCEKLVEYDVDKRFRIVTFCEESRAAYDRVGLTSFFAHRNAEKLMIARLDWYNEHGIQIHIGDRACQIDRDSQVVTSEKGEQIAYDYAVMATGSYPFVPPVDGIRKKGVFVYRTIEDLEKIIDYARGAEKCAVIGGGLLGLEAAKAAHDLNLETHVVEFASRLMPRQIDDAGSEILVQKISDLDVQVHLNKATEKVLGDTNVSGMKFADGEQLDVDMIIVSAGIRPRDDLARESGLEVGPRGGIRVNSKLTTSDPRIFAVGECALHDGMVYGLIAPGWEMAEVAAAQICGIDKRFNGTDLSTMLKLMGVDVASFGDYELSDNTSTSLVHRDPFAGIYKKLLFNKAGTRLLGGILVGDAADYGLLSSLAKSDEPLPATPAELMGMGTGFQLGADAMSDSSQVCSCNNVSKGQICDAIREKRITSPGQVKSCTKAGSGCGGCMPLVTDILHAELRAAGIEVSNHLCEHFSYSRTELFAIIKAKQLKTFSAVMKEVGTGHGCEICKPAIASILATLFNEHIIGPEHQTLQDTNDRFLANTQRDGSFSVIPRVPGGEITPEKLITIGETAQEFGLYTKITGAQRVDLFGAQVQDLPSIWERLVDAGFESGHAYGKALRTVKSCVGSTWCRYGVQDSVGFAIQLENRYKGLRAPHKLKSAVSGCVRECAEAQSKDFGLVATDNGYNLYLCGNGGATPRHGDLVATDIDAPTAIRYIDRFLMYYCMTADKLTRTSVWVEKLEGGIDHIREVIIDDKLGICNELERMMQFVVDSYRCEWKEVVRNSERRKWFRQFVNTDDTEPVIEIISERGQSRPGDWPSESVSLDQIRMLDGRTLGEHEQEQLESPRWIQVGMEADFPLDGGSTVKYGNVQIAVFNFSSRGAWYACQQMCPHKKAFVLSRGILGDSQGEPKVACPLHKKNFSLNTGECTSGDDYSVRVFPAKVDAGRVFLELPPTQVLDKLLSTEIGKCLATSCSAELPPEVAVEAGVDT